MPRFVKVKVKAGARRESIFVEKTNTLHIAVKEPAQDNRANDRMIAVVAGHFHVGRKAIEIVSGHHRPNKLLKIHSRTA